MPTPIEGDFTEMTRLLTTDDAVAILQKRFYDRTDEEVAGLVRFLSTEVAFFRRVHPDIISVAVERMAHSKVEGAGGVIVRQGDADATHAFIVLRGNCHVYQKGSEGGSMEGESRASDDPGELRDDDVTVGDAFGELGVMMITTGPSPGAGGGGGGAKGGDKNKAVVDASGGGDATPPS